MDGWSKLIASFQKLVRDKIPEILASKGMTLMLRDLNQKTFVEALKQKLVEEANEVLIAETQEALVEELADCWEVLLALARTEGISMETIEQKRLLKKHEKGGFEQGFFIERVERPSDSKKI